jgi:chromosome partitioning protein
MRKIAILSQKGGAGKTTLTINLSVALADAGLTVFTVDTDRQGSLKKWYERREAAADVADDVRARLLVGHIDAKRLQTRELLDEVVARAADVGRCDVMLFDTPPHVDGGNALLASTCDAVLVVCQPRALDLSAIAATVEAIPARMREAGTARVVLTMCPPRSGFGENAKVRDARRAIEEAYGIRVAEPVMRRREAYADSVAGGYGVTEHGDRAAGDEVLAVLAVLNDMLVAGAARSAA